MTSVIAALTFGGKWTIYDKDSVKTSFPTFIAKIKSLGGRLSWKIMKKPQYSMVSKNNLVKIQYWLKQ